MGVDWCGDRYHSCAGGGHVIRVGVFLFCPSQYAFNSSLLKVGVAFVTQEIFAIGVSSFFMYAYGSTMVALHNTLMISTATPSWSALMR
uniref:hypothetical protein n=1 Tax=Vibrio cholerae TaxID=666 RepID=UPI003F588E25